MAWFPFAKFVPVRIFCSILSICVLLLSAAPCCADDDCADEATSQSTEHHDCTNCSPFLTCGTCPGFVYSIIKFNFTAPVAVHFPVFFFHTTVLTENCYVSIWQPPKIS